MYKIVFSNSGDEIKFNPCNHELIEFYVSELNQIKENNFYCTDTTKIKNCYKNLAEAIQDINLVLRKINNFQFPSEDNCNYLNQDLLNKIHEDFVLVQKQPYDIRSNQNHESDMIKELANLVLHFFDDDNLTPTISNVLHKLDVIEIYRKVNTNLHNLESSFINIKYQTKKWIEIQSTINKKIITNNRTQIYFPFAHLGRTLYNKFLTFDSDLEYKDENTFNELLGILGITLQPTETNFYSTQYLEWCKKHNKEPTGQTIEIGEFPDLDKKLFDYRKILYRNNTQNNSFHIELN